MLALLYTSRHRCRRNYHKRDEAWRRVLVVNSDVQRNKLETVLDKREATVEKLRVK